MAKLIDEARSNSLMSILLKQVYDTITNGGDPDSVGPNDFIAFDPIGIVLTDDTFDFALKGLFGSAPSPKPELDKDGKPILDKNGNPVIDMEGYKNLLTENKFRRYLQMEQFAAMVDAIPSQIPPMVEGKNGRQVTIFNDSSKRVSKVYEDLLQWSVVVDTPMDAKVEKKLSSLRNKLFKIKKIKNPDFDETLPIDDTNQPEVVHSFVSPMYAKYVEYEMKYYAEVEKNNEVRVAADNGDPDAMAQLSIDGKNMKKREDTALKAWQSLGYKEGVERIQNYLSEIEEKHMLVIKKRLQSEFRNSQRTRILDYINYSPSIPIPAGVMKESKNWPTIVLNEREFSLDSSSTTHKWKAGLGLNLGIFSIGARGGGEHQNRESEIDMSNVYISFKLGKVRVERGWFSQEFVESKYWKLHENSPQELNGDTISTGNDKDGLMPSIITELIIAKEVIMRFGDSTTNTKFTKDYVNAGGVIGIGPFVLGGGYSYENQESHIDASSKGKDLLSPGCYIIGYKCHIVPKSPNPNPAITKWTDGKSE
ncbi:MAG: hypothetical protein WCR50_02965 [Proteiniphilum sp.]|jgi:hypothetical protein|nr:hypothetical protein [Proteiniphilum sp.]NCB24300.1 hypothetical protein [Bacteroidia bacterium]MDD2936869.1 hypothetical protein [Proteiniphilum sp.]MDD3076778.1 hypothetical protein [Proteiniphilum sp.]MDD3954846.1 hypothetical protein [Proteiniphilum sp.]